MGSNPTRVTNPLVVGLKPTLPTMMFNHQLTKSYMISETSKSSESSTAGSTLTINQVDLLHANFMRRGGQLVFTDPVA